VDNFNVGDVIDGRYTITDVLGRGGMGVVFEATRPGLTTRVAIKVLLPHLCEKAELAGRFAREARIADTLQSEHVARVLDVGTTAAGTAFMVMERLIGKDLGAVIAARGPLPLDETVDLLLQACVALCEAHKHGIIHRDLKPANIFVTKTVDGRPLVKVLDFGIAKAASLDDLVQTRTDALFGTSYYMSPEQLQDTKRVDARTDVWALGIVLYEVLTGAQPFQGETPHLIMTAIALGKYTALSAVRADLPAELDAFLAEALAPKHELRLPSIEAFARRLAPFGTSGARQSYERIERLAGGATQADAAPPSATPLLLAETAGIPNDSPVRTDSPLVKTDAPPPAEKPRSRRVPALVALAGVGLLGGFVGIRHLVPASPTSATASPPIAEAAPSASAVASAPAPSASAESAPVASAAPSAAVRAVLADPAAAAPVVSSAKTGGECAKGATAACEGACTAHVPGRCEALAKALVKGTGAPKNVARAVTLYQGECDGGSGSACNALGALYGTGNEVPKDEPKAVTLYQRGCEHADRTACMNLGGMLFDGSGTAKNQPLAVSYFQRSCPSSGPVEPLGCLNLSVAYGQGLGAPKDASQSLAYAKEACDNGAPRGCTRLSMAKLTGEGVPKDVPGGIAELDGMCGKGEPSACAQLLSLFSRGLGTDVQADPARVRATAEKGCKAHDAQSCKVKSLLETQDHGETNIAMNNGQLEASCTAGSMTNCGFLGERVLAGQGVPADRARGIGLLDKACKGGATRACQKLAEAGHP
jgi:serine/threonine protein kinase/TPR repeat protein